MTKQENAYALCNRPASWKAGTSRPYSSAAGQGFESILFDNSRDWVGREA